MSEFETEEKAVAYQRWLEEKVAKSLAEGRPPVPHEQVMAEMRDIIVKAKQKRPC